MTSPPLDLVAYNNAKKLSEHDGDQSAIPTPDSCGLQRSISQPWLHQALDVFLSDTIVHASSGSQSHSHFSGLVALVDSSSRNDALPYALEAVALASLAKRLCSNAIQQEATRRYIISIRQLRDMNLTTKSDAFCVIASIILMSMYEIVNADRNGDSNWIHHFRGISTIMKDLVQRDLLSALGIPTLVLGTEPCLLNLLNLQSTDYTPLFLGTIVMKPVIPQFNDLCLILPKVQALFSLSATVLEQRSLRYESILKQHRDQAIALSAELHAWRVAQSEFFQPLTIVRFTQPYTLRFLHAEDLVCPATRADTYSDYSTACMWNTYRQCQLHLTDLLIRITRLLSRDPEAYHRSREYRRSCNEIQSLVDDISASWIFLLVSGRISGSKPDGSVWCQNRPPTLIGGLSLQWVLFTVSILENVSVPSRQTMNTCLLWIGKHLGIGQASILAHMDRNAPGGITAKGDALRWTGFLI